MQRNGPKNAPFMLAPEEIFELCKQCPATEVTESIGEYHGPLPTGDNERWKGIAESMFDENWLDQYIFKYAF
jgi:hypothetical protein